MTKPKINLPGSHDDWRALLQRAIRQGEKSNDRRVAGLRNALVTGDVEVHLRKLGIICQADIDREFPDKDSS
jgi:hypothetical protein